MHSLILAALLGAQPDEPVTRINFETLALTAAESLNGKAVVTTVTVDKPAYTWGMGENLRTVFGPRFTAIGDRTVVLKGNRLNDTDRGAKVTLAGTLRVIRHQDATIGGKPFSGFTEIRIEECDMTPALALLVALGVPAQPGDIAAFVKFDTITLKDAERLDGAAVAIRFTAATPATTHGEGGEPAHHRGSGGP